jgi:uncharacterized cupredoxin-like copper-binding protein
VVFVKNYALILIALTSISMLSNALTVKSSPSVAQIFAGQTTAYIQLWITNTANQNVNYYVNTQTQLNAAINPATGTLQSGETKTITIAISSPACFEGVFHAQTTVQLSNNETQVIDTPIKVINQIQCTQYNQQPDYSTTQFPSNSNSSLQPIKSTIQFQQYFNPTNYDIRIIGSNTNVNNNQETLIPLKLINNGASSTFQLILINADPNLNVNFNENSFNILTNEIETVYMRVKPENLQPGTYPIEIEVTQGQQVVTNTNIYVTIQQVYNAQLVMPQTASCQSQIQGSLTNTGNTPDTYTLSSNAQLSQNAITLQPGETKTFTVTSNNQTEITVNAKSNHVQGNATTANTCNNLIQLPSVLVTNNNNYTLPNVTVTANNIPATWDVLSEPPVDLKPGESKNFTLYLRETTPASNVQPTALVESNGNVIAQQQMPEMNGNLSGYFTGIVDNNIAVIGVVIFIAIIVAVASTRAKLDEVEEKTYQQKIQSIKSQIQNH